MAQTPLTFQQVSDKLIKVEEALKSLNKRATKSRVEEEKIKTLELIRESLMKKKITLVEQPQRSTFVTTKAGETKVVTADQGEINVLKKDPNIKSMEDSTGRKLKEQDSDIALNLDYVGKTLTDLFVDFLRDMGEEISETTYTAEGDSKIKVQVHYKEGAKKEYTFELRGTQLYLDDNFLIEIQRLPSGEIQIPKETLTSSLYKYFENQLEFTDSEETLEEGWKQALIGLGLTAATIAGIGKAYLPPSAEELRDKETLQKTVNLQKDALNKTSDQDVLKMVRSLEGFLNTSYLQFSAQQADRLGSEKMSSLMDQEARDVIENLLLKGNDKVKAGFVIKADGTLTWANPSKISPINESTVVDTKGNPLFIGDKIQVGKIIFEICLDSEKNTVYLKTGKNVVYGGTKKFQTLLENSTKKHTEELLTESVEVGDRVKISKSYGGAKGTVVDKRGSFIVLDNGESYHESDVVNISRKLGEDIDVGHVDDEPGMLLQTAYETAVHAASIYKQLKHYQATHEEVDFPNWWQSKVILAKDYVAKADKWLEFATQEGEIIPEEKKPMDNKDKIWLAKHLGYKAPDKGYKREFSTDARAVALLAGSTGIATDIIQAWYAGWDDKDKWNRESEPEGFTLQETKINTKRK